MMVLRSRFLSSVRLSCSADPAFHPACSTCQHYENSKQKQNTSTAQILAKKKNTLRTKKRSRLPSPKELDITLVENVIQEIAQSPDLQPREPPVQDSIRGSTNTSPSIRTQFDNDSLGNRTYFINLSRSKASSSIAAKHALVNVNCHSADQNRKCQRKSRNIDTSILQTIAEESIVLPHASDCQHCHAKKFHLEPPTFCCSSGQVSLVSHPMPYSLQRLFTSADEEAVQFRKNVRTYNNNFAFTSLGAKYDKDLTKNSRGMYTFRVQGQVYHFLNGLSSDSEPKTGIQFYFYDPDEEISRRLNTSDKLRKSTLELLSTVLQENPYSKFFRDLRHVPDLQDHKIFLSCTPELDQRRYNLPSTSQVAAIFSESDDASIDKQSHIQVYSHSNTSYRVKHYYGCYDPLQYPLLLP